MPTRYEGYQLSAGKEGPAICLARKWLLEVLECDTERIHGKEDNYKWGDLKSKVSGKTIEVKGQPIKPRTVVEQGYQKNFIELFEVTDKAGHEGGFAEVATVLGMKEDELADKSVKFHAHSGSTSKRTQQGLGHPPRVSCSLRSIDSSALTIYVNVGLAIICVYRSRDLIQLIQTEVRKATTVIDRGMGGANDRTHTVMVDYGTHVWFMDDECHWQYYIKDNPAEATSIKLLHEALV